METIKEFAGVIGERIFEALPEIAEKTTVSITEVVKNNDVTLTALCIKEDESNIGMNIYLNDAYERYLKGKPLDLILSDLRESYLNNRTEGVDVEWFNNWETVRDRITCRVVNKELCKKRNDNVPYREFEDLAITYVANCRVDGKNGTILINNDHIKRWNIKEEDLWQAAQDNFKNEGYTIQGITDVLNDMGYKDELPPLDDVPMFVVSNKTRFGGASVIANKEFLNKILDKVGKNFFIIPSSIHEILCVPDDGKTDADTLREMIREVNDTQVEPEEVLSYNPYYYSEEGLKIA